MFEQILQYYGLNAEGATVAPFGTGLINHTWRVTAPAGDFILQRVNSEVFKSPGDIAANICEVGEYLSAHHPSYRFVAPVKTTDGKEMAVIEGDGYYRMFPFLAGSHSKNVVKTSEEAWEAAAQFGNFTRVLAGFPAQKLRITIPHFHDLRLRYDQFTGALQDGNPARLNEARELIEELQEHTSIVTRYDRLIKDPDFHIRVTHHDTKISNVLFDDKGKGLCVIDLDTIMPGFFISDVGDMIRTYLSPATEEEKDFEGIYIREDFYKAIVAGYCSGMKDELTGKEKQHFFFAGEFMIYMQALRFLTDHLYDDRYYGAAYPGHNLIRAGNQAVLLRRLVEKQEPLSF
ncbi:MAG TPA: aminoglycoside phosphotransferase family protein [Chitinophagaceae bacterium]|nr:aminoglycoside phosphotransferase family protein [Chitinophagaceae bacterium]